MRITIVLDLPDTLLNEAKAHGLLESSCIGMLLEAELKRRKSAKQLDVVLSKIHDQPSEVRHSN